MNLRTLHASFLASIAFALFLVPPPLRGLDMTLISPGVWFLEGDFVNQNHCNNLVIEMRDYLIVVDANYPSGAQVALDAVKRVSAKPVRYVFDTHHHEDHSYGNAVWTRAGAVTVAFQGVGEEMQRYEPTRYQSISRTRKDVAELNLPNVEAPKQLIRANSLVLKDESREVRFHFFGWAHTRGDGFVYLPREKILATGDVVVNGPYNYLGDANIGNWPKVIERAERLDVNYVVPGHGKVGGREILTGQRQLLMALYRAVQNAVLHGEPLSHILSDNGTGLSERLPDSVRNWIGKDFSEQVRFTYQEISQRKPAGDIPHD
jgi:glyoxylase-like metal-dependent hydrolase (beta-lactamase superfamily II)